MERAFQVQLLTFTEENGVLSAYQSGFSFLFGTRQKLENVAQRFSLTPHQKNIKQVSMFKYLGVVLDEQLLKESMYRDSE